MTLSITLPNVGKPKTVKDAIISILVEKWPLSTRKLHNNVRRMDITATYQAVHKALKELEGDKIVSKSGKEYTINNNWLENVINFGREAKKSYSEGCNNKTKEMSNLTLNSICEVDMFLADFIKGLDNGQEKETVCINWNHYWVPLFLDKQLYAQFRELASAADIYSISYSDTPIDRWCHEFWKKTPIKPKIAPESQKSDFIVYKDSVMQIFYPEFLKKELDRIFSSAKDIKDLDVDALFKNVFQRKVIIPVTVNNNHVLAEQLRNQVLGYFKGDK
jgi:hypothetical protein